MQVLGRIGDPGRGKVIVGLDDEWLTVWNEGAMTFSPPEHIQSFTAKVLDDIDEPPADADLLLASIIRAGELDPLSKPPPIPEPPR